MLGGPMRCCAAAWACLQQRPWTQGVSFLQLFMACTCVGCARIAHGPVAQLALMQVVAAV
jgi:hypothetical protein